MVYPSVGRILKGLLAVKVYRQSKADNGKAGTWNVSTLKQPNYNVEAIVCLFWKLD